MSNFFLINICDKKVLDIMNRKWYIITRPKPTKLSTRELENMGYKGVYLCADFAKKMSPHEIMHLKLSIRASYYLDITL